MSKVNYNEKFKEAVELIRKRLIWIILFSSFLTALVVAYKSLLPNKYAAKSLFYPDRKEATLSGSPLELIQGDVAAKAGALGILSKVLISRTVTNRIANYKLQAPYNAKYEILADWIVDDNNKAVLPWQKKVDIHTLTKEQKVNRAAAILRSGCVTVIDESGFMSLENFNYSPELAMLENKIIINELINFNFEITTQKVKQDLDYITNRVDSIRDIYENLKYQNAQFNDVNKYMIKSVVKVPLEDLEENKKIIAARYNRLVDMQEQAIVRYQSDKPIIKVLDYPYIESVIQASVFTPALMMFVLSFLAFTIFACRKVFAAIIKAEIEAMRNKQNEEENEESEQEIAE